MVLCPGPYPWYQFLHSIATSQMLSRYIEPHFLKTTEGSSWAAFLHDLKISGPLVFDAKNDLALVGDDYPGFFLSF